ncbi:Tripartite tricarboxylate transporter family receptor [compost metagenome]
MFAPVNTPPETVQKLNQAVQDFMNQPDTKETLRKMMVEPVYQSSAEYKTWLDKESSEWAALIKRADIKVQ